MKFAQLSRTFYEWGWQIKHEHYVAFSDYLKAMLKKNRVMLILKDGEIEAIILFYITDNYDKVYKKFDWEVVDDNENGNLAYIDKMVCKKYTKSLRMAIYDALVEKYPNIDEAMYLRAKDRKVIIRRQECTK